MERDMKIGGDEPLTAALERNKRLFTQVCVALEPLFEFGGETTLESDLSPTCYRCHSLHGVKSD